MITKETSSPLDSKYGVTPILLQQPLEVVESSTNYNSTNAADAVVGYGGDDHLSMNEIKEKSHHNDSIAKHQLIGLDDDDGEDQQGVIIDDDRPRSDLVQLPVSEMPPLPIEDTKESPTKASSSMKFEWPLLFERFVVKHFQQYL